MAFPGGRVFPRPAVLGARRRTVGGRTPAALQQIDCTTIGGPGRITRTTASLNRGHGIDARWVPGVPTGIVEGGGNRASRNATPPQCLGVTC